jgi:NAD(P)-dependent dehydrogenase (short-subunit alcohol dehydrogenase family)
MSGRLSGKVAVVTGAASGIGLSVAKRFHAEGASVVLADISGKEKEIAASMGNRAVAINADVSRSEDAKAMIDFAVTSFGGLDILCNNAGAGSKLVPFTDVSREAFDRMIDINLRSIFMAMQHAIPHMVARGGGSIVNVASTAALLGMPQMSEYAASKAGSLAVTRCTAIEYARSGVRVNAVCPGFIDTPMSQAAIHFNPAILEYAKQLIPMGRIGTSDEVASAILFLASDESSYITGAVIPVEGGQTTA